MSNKKIILTIGIPASGKSTWRREFLAKNAGWVAVSRDEFRLMLAGSQMMDYKGEKLVTELVNKAIATAIRNKYNVIVDQTNVNIKYLNEMVSFCENLADVEFKIFDISLEKAIERDKNRDASVGAEVIKTMYKNYLNLFDSNFDFSNRNKKAHISENIKWKKNGNSPNAVICDIDGTVAHMQGRRGAFDWDRVNVDVVDEKIREVLNVFKTANYEIIMVTGRDGISKDMTRQWLKDNKIPFDALFTKPENDFRKDTITKTEIYNDHIKGKFNVLCAFDDRKQAVDLWRSLGVKCMQVEDGDF